MSECRECTARRRAARVRRRAEATRQQREQLAALAPHTVTGICEILRTLMGDAAKPYTAAIQRDVTAASRAEDDWIVVNLIHHYRPE